jgi:hypothetical protein
MNTTWKEHYKLRTFDVDLTNHVKISSIFNFMQESAANKNQTITSKASTKTTKKYSRLPSNGALKSQTKEHSDKIQ